MSWLLLLLLLLWVFNRITFQTCEQQTEKWPVADVAGTPPTIDCEAHKSNFKCSWKMPLTHNWLGFSLLQQTPSRHSHAAKQLCWRFYWIKPIRYACERQAPKPLHVQPPVLLMMWLKFQGVSQNSRHVAPKPGPGTNIKTFFNPHIAISHVSNVRRVNCSWWQCAFDPGRCPVSSLAGGQVPIELILQVLSSSWRLCRSEPAGWTPSLCVRPIKPDLEPAKHHPMHLAFKMLKWAWQKLNEGGVGICYRCAFASKATLN